MRRGIKGRAPFRSTPRPSAVSWQQPEDEDVLIADDGLEDVRDEIAVLTANLARREYLRDPWRE
jgi:hypothetical protein